MQHIHTKDTTGDINWCSQHEENTAEEYLRFHFLKDFIYFRERGKEGGREGEKHQCVVASHMPPTGDLAHNPGTCPDWESNQQPSASQAGAQSTEPHQPGLQFHFRERISECLLYSYLYKHLPLETHMQKLSRWLHLGGRTGLLFICFHLLGRVVGRQGTVFALSSKHVGRLGWPRLLPPLTSMFADEGTGPSIQAVSWRPPDVTCPLCRAVKHLRRVRILTVPLMG